MSSKIKRYGAATTPLDRDGIAQAQNVVSGTALTLNGALTSLGPTGAKEFVGVNGRAIAVSFYSGADMTSGGKGAVVSGFADFGRSEPITETILFPNTTYVLGTKAFAIITSIVPNGSIAQNLEVGTDADATNATASTVYVPLDFNSNNINAQTNVTGTVTGKVAASMDPIIDGQVRLQDAVFIDVTGLTALAAAQRATIPSGSTMLRLTYTAATGSEGIVLTVVEGAYSHI